MMSWFKKKEKEFHVCQPKWMLMNRDPEPKDINYFFGQPWENSLTHDRFFFMGNEQGCKWVAMGINILKKENIGSNE